MGNLAQAQVLVRNAVPTVKLLIGLSISAAANLTAMFQIGRTIEAVIVGWVMDKDVLPFQPRDEQRLLGRFGIGLVFAECGGHISCRRRTRPFSRFPRCRAQTALTSRQSRPRAIALERRGSSRFRTRAACARAANRVMMRLHSSSCVRTKPTSALASAGSCGFRPSSPPHLAEAISASSNSLRSALQLRAAIGAIDRFASSLSFTSKPANGLLASVNAMIYNTMVYIHRVENQCKSRSGETAWRFAYPRRSSKRCN